MVLGYKIIQFNTHQNLGYEPLPEPLEDEIDTEGCWIQLPDNVVMALQAATEQSTTKTTLFDYFKALAHSLKSAAELKVMATFSDIGGDDFVFTNEKEQSQSKAIILYDQYPEGLGFSEKAFEHIKEIIKNAVYLVKNCRCKTGCPACVGDYRIDKKIILWALENFFVETNPPKDLIVPEKPKIEQIKYKYTWDKIVEDWVDLVELMKNHKIYGANFLSTAKSVSVENASLILHFPTSAAKIADKDEIKQAISNSLAQFMRLPKGFSLSFKSIDSANENRKHFKLMRHFKGNKK